MFFYVFTLYFIKTNRNFDPSYWLIEANEELLDCSSITRKYMLKHLIQSFIWLISPCLHFKVVQLLVCYELLWDSVWSVFIKQRNSLWKVSMLFLPYKGSSKTVHDNHILSSKFTPWIKGLMHDMIRKAEHRSNYFHPYVHKHSKDPVMLTVFQPSCKANKSLDSRDETFALGDKTLNPRDESQDETLVSWECGN